MKKPHEYNNSFKEEYKKAIQFLKKGCKCRCSDKVHSEEFAKIRARFRSLSKKEQDAIVMGQLLISRGGKTSLSKRLKKKERVNRRTFYRWDHNTPICLETYLNMLGISHTYLEYVRNHFMIKGLSTRTHSNVGKIPIRKTKMLIDQHVKKVVKNFINKLAQTHGLPDPGRIKRITQPVIYLPTEKGYSSVYRDFLASRMENDKLKQLKYDVFRRLWHELTPHVKFMKPKTDLCDTCHKIRNEIHSCKDEKEKATQKKNFFDTKTEPTKRKNTTTKTQN